MDWGVGLQGWVGAITPRLGLTAAVVGHSEVGVEEDIRVYLCVGTWLDDDIATIRKYFPRLALRMVMNSHL